MKRLLKPPPRIALIDAGFLRSTWGNRLAVRIGIHTGTVVMNDVGDAQHIERMAMGDVPNIAARDPTALSETAASFRRALHVAREQGARLLEAKASHSLERIERQRRSDVPELSPHSRANAN